MVIELKRGEVPDIVLNNLFAQTPLETVFGINMVALQDGQPKLMSPEGDAGGVPPPSPRSHHPPHDLRSAQGARARPCARRSRGRARQHRRDHRAHQGIAVARRGARRADGQALPAGAVPKMLERVGASASRPDGVAGEWGLQGEQLRAQRRAGAGHPRHAPEPPHRAGAGQDHRRVHARCSTPSRISRTSSRGPSASPRCCATSCSKCATQYGDARRTEISLDHLEPDDGRSDRAAGRGGHAVARGLREVAAGVRLPGAASRRSGQGGGGGEG